MPISEAISKIPKIPNVELITNLDKSLINAFGFNCKILLAEELASPKLPNIFEIPTCKNSGVPAAYISATGLKKTTSKELLKSCTLLLNFS